ncbi:adenylate/guanylate cyclase domain-containing protein [Bradyrhizobium sp. 180]|uniref:adenylate/guanylate cyclase domain-containing protein n=1 Tax=unclassified Bradyrhizobium TaxID=2631580 RepID=UPI001FF7ABB1|nr:MULTISPECIES: adenylate/guanylate cyclase domain-containing protein [unclassified Bradyrhizobium]MCK1419566.1 adenylate/guanylate cyclase domain-containing protein [Bradyrhizobium sp. CW12]MCK1489967.1 adenylate/guanylate cyclase domain-containing protein [Bradyrhizobium sp. 180]MCK1527705.1 adenylate/guanylate cyclase domain-containing protein [Bradyrhizobium sp. 182]MCK1595787.1 adenylate/guanylate cyclase domain-containing protein [Bradyrhizobium sp. 164]MCK1618287.1 adenylate/guanylate 
MPIFNQSIRRKIVGVALGLIVLMLITSILSMVMSSQVGVLLDELTNRYIPAYGHLARANVRSLERALALRRMVMTKMQSPSDEEAYAARLREFDQTDRKIEEEAESARKLINAIIDDPRTPSDYAALARIELRIETAVTELRRDLDEDHGKLVKQVDAKQMAEARGTLEHIDALRDQFNQKIDAIRTDMLAQVFFSTSQVISRQHQTIIVSGVVTLLAAIVGFAFALLVSSGITRPVRLLLAGTREVEAGRFDKPITVSTQDEIGELAAAFNRMIEQLRHNERIRETFGRYIDPKVVQGLIDRPEVAIEGQRRVMTIMFCDMSGFTSMSEGMTPRGLVKVMNHYFTVMSGPIRSNRGVIDKYIGDAIMSYWGPPFIEEDEQAMLAGLAAIEMADQVPALQKQLPDLLGIRAMPAPCDLRIGIATGEVLTGSIGSELMMSFTVMGDAVNLASRLEAANKAYGTRILISQATAEAVGARLELREIDRLAVAGQSAPQAVFEVMGRANALTDAQASLRTHYAEGLSAYRARRFGDARAAFNAALEAVPGDGPSRTLLGRITQFEANPPDGGWDGAWRLEQK